MFGAFFFLADVDIAHAYNIFNSQFIFLWLESGNKAEPVAALNVEKCTDIFPFFEELSLCRIYIYSQLTFYKLELRFKRKGNDNTELKASYVVHAWYTYTHAIKSNLN